MRHLIMISPELAFALTKISVIYSRSQMVIAYNGLFDVRLSARNAALLNSRTSFGEIQDDEC
jgi:hypothetical protein